MLHSYDHLDELMISACRNLTEKSHDTIGLKTKLRTLKFHDLTLSGFQVNKLKRLSCVATLSLIVKIVDESVPWIASNLKELTTLGLYVSAGNTSNCFKILSSLPLLKKLEVLGDPNIVKYLFSQLVRIPTLKEVALGFEACDVDDYHEWLSQLNEVTTVKKISFVRKSRPEAEKAVSLERILSVMTSGWRWSLNLLPNYIHLYRI